MPAPCVVRAVSEIPASVLGAATACLPLLCHHEKRPGGELFSPSGPLGHVELPVVCCGNPAQPEAPNNKINNSPVCLTAGGRLMAYPPASSPSVILLTTSEKPIDRDRFPVEESIGSKVAGSRVIRAPGFLLPRHNSFLHNELSNCRIRHNVNNREIQARQSGLFSTLERGVAVVRCEGVSARRSERARRQ